MFEEIFGVTAHPLFVHAAVVMVPLLAFAAVAYALVPPVRRWTWWLVAGLAVIAPVAAWFATLSGNRLRTRFIGQELMLQRIDEHRDLGDATLWSSLGLAVFAVIYIAMTKPWAARTPRVRYALAQSVGSPPSSGDVDSPPQAAGAAADGPTAVAVAERVAVEPPRMPRPSPSRLVVLIVLTVAVLFFAAASLYFVIRTGHSGAGMVWGVA